MNIKVRCVKKLYFVFFPTVVPFLRQSKISDLVTFMFITFLNKCIYTCYNGESNKKKSKKIREHLHP